MANKSTKSWEIFDEFWEKVKDKIPKAPKRSQQSVQTQTWRMKETFRDEKGFGRDLLRSEGIQRKALPKKHGAVSTVHRYFTK